MEPLTTDEVARIAGLARLSLTDTECDELASELSELLEHFATLAELDAQDVEPMTHAVPMMLRLRDDIIEESLPVEVAVGAAADRDDGLFRVPSILSGSDD